MSVPPPPADRREFLLRSGLTGAALLFGSACSNNSGGSGNSDAADAGTDRESDTSNGNDTAIDAPDTADVQDAVDTSSDAEVYEEAQAGWPSCEPGAATQTITFVHVNDIHGNFAPARNGANSAARLRGYFDRVKSENPFTLFTNGGDDFEKGCLAELTSSGAATIRYVEAMGYDVRCIGNHDFCWSPERLLEYSRAGSAAVLCSNVTYTGPDATLWGAKRSFILEVGCLRIGFFGLVSKPWNERNEQTSGDFFPEHFPSDWDFEAVTREMVTALRPQVDLVVAISHLGFGDDTRLAAAVPGIDIILGAHSHTVLMQMEQVGDTRIIQCGSSAAWLGRLDVTVDLATRRPVDFRYRMTPNIPTAAPENPRVAAELRSIFDTYSPDAHETAATVRLPADAVRIADITAQAAITALSCDAAVVDADTVWTTWGAGSVTKQEFLDTFKVERQPAGTPGFNSFYTVTLQGSLLEGVRRATGARWRYAGPDLIDPAANYTLAVQKILAFNGAHYLGAGLDLPDPAPVGEAWEILASYAAIIGGGELDATL